MKLGKKVIFFCAGDVPTEDEAGQIARLRLMYEKVAVRNARVSNTFGPSGVNTDTGRLEPADALAGTVPTAYKTDGGEVDTELYEDGELDTLVATDGPDAAIITPGTVSIAANGGTAQLSAIVGDVDDETGVVTLTNRSSGTGVAWESDTPSKATVSSAGLVTGQNAGTGVVVITYTYTNADDVEVTATRNVTLT